MHEVDVSGSSQYLIKIMKMRQSDHVKASMPYEITSKGLNVFK
jgi:KaiC/GvpD/RAD55 family RecA-like ATPase